MTSTERPQQSTAGADAPERPRLRRSPLAIATVAAAVLIAGGGGAYFATSASGDATDGGSGAAGSGKPPPLALDGAASGSGTGSVAGTGPSEPPGIAPGEPDPSGVTYRAKGALPDGPATARVYRTNGEVAAADVARLAGALGVAGAPRSDGTVWKVGTEKDGSGPLLRVDKQAPGTWTFERYGPSGGDNCLKGKSCPSMGGAGGSGSVAGTGGDGRAEAVSEAAAKRAAAPVLKSLGQDQAALDARQLMGAIRVVNADPVVGGLPTHGWSTGIQVDANGHVTGGTGQLTAPEESDSYPVIGADEALKELNAPGDATGGGIGGCATPAPLEEPLEKGTSKGTSSEGGNPAAPCLPKSAPNPEPLVVEKAVFGLAMRSVDGRGALVPSWLFEVAPGGDALPYTVAHPAVAPEFLAKPKPPQSRPQPSEESPGGRVQRVTSYTAEGRTLTLHFSGGMCSTYTPSADESGTAVKVRLTEFSEPGTVCVAMAKVMTAKVTLDKPLGDRRVIEATTGDPLPLKKS
ncbi:hypothetical protein M1203_18625 [Streptomyces sp. 35G-GA-8]|nr:hypothetical protein [Streptomyces sp. 35G-GA-8]MCL7378894.1 hypothetical protein [Streptomyces sp. 35G-GA-8]